jgi:hypothetical protein
MIYENDAQPSVRVAPVADPARVQEQYHMRHLAFQGKSRQLQHLDA